VKGQDPVKWAVGQPLGSYMSWPLFTLTHHLLVQFAAFKVLKEKEFEDYQLLGDDIVIWNELVSGEYRRILDELSIPVSESKTITSTMGHSSGEFAKRLFMQGIEVSPIPLHLIVESQTNRYQMPTLFELMQERWEIDVNLSGHLAFRSSFIPPKLANILNILMGFRRILKGECAFPWCSFGEAEALFKRLSGYFIEKQAESTSLVLTKKSMRKAECFSVDAIKQSLKQSGLVVPDSLLNYNYDEDYDPHPIVLLFNRFYQNKVEGSKAGATWTAFKYYENLPSQQLSAQTIKESRIPMVESMKLYFTLSKDPAVSTLVLKFFYDEAARILAVKAKEAQSS